MTEGQTRGTSQTPNNIASTTVSTKAAMDATETPELYKRGDRIDGRYEVLDVHRGGMGVVYATYDHVSGMPFALKTIQERFLTDLLRRDLFTEEASVWVRLGRHEFIVRAHTVEVIDRRTFVIADYIRGPESLGSTLNSWLGQPRLTQEVAVKFAYQIAMGMCHAQQRIPGMVHRDLKPANILVDERGRAMVSDFGLVRAMPGSGTAPYMAPEQWQGQEIDPRTDIYAFGCILYEMTTGRRMFAASDAVECRSAHLNQSPVPPRELAPAIKPSIEIIILRCVEKDRDLRPQNWESVASEIAACMFELTGHQPEKGIDTRESTPRELSAASYSLYCLGKYADSLSISESAIGIDSSFAPAWFYKGLALEALKHHEQAIECLNRVIEIDPGDAGGWKTKGIILRNNGRFDDAIRCFDTALKIDPNRAECWSEKAVALGQSDRFKESMEHHDKALSLDPNQTNSWNNKGITLAAMKDYNAAIEQYDRGLAINANLAELWNNKGLAYAETERYEAAIDNFDRALGIDPNYASCMGNKARALLFLGKAEEAIALCDLSLNIDSSSPETWTTRGNAFVGSNRAEQAMSSFDRALLADRDCANAWYAKGSLHAKLKQFPQALSCYHHALSLDPMQVSAWNNRGSLFGMLNRFDESVSSFDEALAIKPDHVNSWAGRGIALISLKRYEEAIASLDRALQIDPQLAVAIEQKNIALTLWKQLKPERSSDIPNTKPQKPVSGLKKALGRLFHSTTTTPLGLGQVASTPASIRGLCTYLQMPEEAEHLSTNPVYSEKGRLALFRILEATERSFGRDHPCTAIVLEDLGLVGSPDITESAIMWNRCLQIRERQLGPEHPDTMKVRHFLGAMYQHTGRHDKSIPFHERNLAILDSTQSENFFHFDQMLSSLAISYRVLGNMTGAEKCWRRLLSRTERRRGRNHLESAIVAQSLAGLLSRCGRYEEALPLLDQTLQVLTHSSRADDERLLKVKASITSAQAALAGRTETERWLSQEWELKDVTDSLARLRLRLPAMWKLEQSKDLSVYRDLRTPQYNFLISSLDAPRDMDNSRSSSEIARSIIRLNPTALSVEYRALGTNRAVALYLNSIRDPDGQKDDRHWLVVDTHLNVVKIAMFTLSVLADMARKHETNALILMLEKEIGMLQFET